MGGSASKSATRALSTIISNIAVSSVQDCVASVAQDQSINVVNHGFRLFGSYRLTQQSEIRASCFSDVQKQTTLQNNIIAAVAQSVSTSNVALLGAFGSSHASATLALTNMVRNNVTMANIQRSYDSIKQRQAASFTNYGVIGFERADLIQGAKLFAAATLQEVDKAGVFSAIAAHVDQHTTATMSNPLDFIGKAIGAVGGSAMMMIVFVVFIIIAAFLGIRMAFSSGSALAIPIGR